MTILEMLVRGAALEPMFFGQGPDIRGRSNASVIQAAKDYVQATGGASSFSVEIVNKRCGHAVLLSITKSAIRKRRWLADVRRYRVVSNQTVSVDAHRVKAVRTTRSFDPLPLKLVRMLGQTSHGWLHQYSGDFGAG
jgi:hypothetical protein